jgi:hypothetical protein
VSDPGSAWPPHLVQRDRAAVRARGDAASSRCARCRRLRRSAARRMHRPSLARTARSSLPAVDARVQRDNLGHGRGLVGISARRSARTNVGGSFSAVQRAIQVARGHRTRATRSRSTSGARPRNVDLLCPLSTGASLGSTTHPSAAARARSASSRDPPRDLRTSIGARRCRRLGSVFLAAQRATHGGHDLLVRERELLVRASRRFEHCPDSQHTPHAPHQDPHRSRCQEE